MRTRSMTHLVLAVVLAVTTAGVVEAQGAPQLAVPSKIIDVGTVSQGVVADARELL